jgi:protein-S-isoprenylcysteine O-methyltransferase Ste14
MDSRKLITQTLLMTVGGVIVLAAVLLIPAWTFDYWQAWVFIAVFVASTEALGIYLAVNDPALLQRRMQGGPTAEQRPVQRIVISLAWLSFVGIMVLSALDHRFGWSSVPPVVSLAGDLLVVLGLVIHLVVFRANPYGAANVRVTEDQRVISSGPYGMVRHPMYVGVLVMVAGIPLALGSLWGLLAVAVTVPVLVWRILDEEALLAAELPGYANYMQTVRNRLVPFVW